MRSIEVQWTENPRTLEESDDHALRKLEGTTSHCPCAEYLNFNEVYGEGKSDCSDGGCSRPYATNRDIYPQAFPKEPKKLTLGEIEKSGVPVIYDASTGTNSLPIPEKPNDASTGTLPIPEKPNLPVQLPKMRKALIDRI